MTNQTGFPSELKPVVKKRMDRGDSKTLQSEQCNNLIVSVWQDEPVIVVATNIMETARWIQHTVSCHLCSINGNMGSVDNNDQLRLLPCTTYV